MKTGRLFVAFGTAMLASGASVAMASSPGTLLWKFPVAYSYGSPAIGADDTIYAGSGDGCLYALTPQGTNQWEFQAGAAINSSPAIGDEGTVFFGCDDGRLYAVNGDGTGKWTTRDIGLRNQSSPALLLGPWDRIQFAGSPLALGRGARDGV